MLEARNMELNCAVQKYAWGKVGVESKVATLCQNANDDFKIDSNAPYAELWMGTHPNAPSMLKCNGTALSTLIADNPSVLGDKSIEKFGKTLPFLFKILSIEKALSIQAHPAKVIYLFTKRRNKCFLCLFSFLLGSC